MQRPGRVPVAQTYPSTGPLSNLGLARRNAAAGTCAGCELFSRVGLPCVEFAGCNQLFLVRKTSGQCERYLWANKFALVLDR